MAGFSAVGEPGLLDLTTLTPTSELIELQSRIQDLEGLLAAFDQMETVNAVVRSSPNKAAALRALQSSPLSLTAQQAETILDMPVSWQTQEHGTALRNERDHLIARRSSLTARTTDTLSFHWFG